MIALMKRGYKNLPVGESHYIERGYYEDQQREEEGRE